MRFTITRNKDGHYYVIDNASIVGMKCTAWGPFRNQEEAEECARCFNMAGLVIT